MRLKQNTIIPYVIKHKLSYKIEIINLTETLRLYRWKKLLSERFFHYHKC